MNKQDSMAALEPNDVARRYGAKPGYQLIDFLQVALPVFVIPIEAIVIASKPLGLVDEFLLRSITENINTLSTISGFLGLDEVFVKKRLGELITGDLIGYAPEPNGIAIAKVTKKGHEAIKKAMLVQAKRASFILAIDGITRQPLAVRRDRLLIGVDARAYGLKEIRAFPDDKAPEFDDLAALDLTQAVAHGVKKEKSIEKVMSLVQVGKRMRRFQEATMLVFRSERGREIHVDFFVDGRPHKQITDAFARHDGVKSLHILEQVEDSVAQTKSEIASVMPGFLAQTATQTAATARPTLQPFVNKVGDIEFKIAEKEFAIDEADSRAVIEKLKQQLEALNVEKVKAETDLSSIVVRLLEVYEHRPLFMGSLGNAKSRLVIISPWITDQVLNNMRLQKLQALVNNGVEVFIGYGTSDNDSKDKGRHAIRFLSELSHKRPNLHFKDLADTHAKVLLVDDKYAVIGSFNWLSFEGDRRKDFREEMSYYVNVKAEIEKLFQIYNKRFI